MFADVTRATVESPDYYRIVNLFHRVFEAHTAVHLTILLFSLTLYICLAGSLPTNYAISQIFSLWTWLRTLSFMRGAFCLTLYERFHDICLEAPKKEMQDAGLSEENAVFASKFLD